MRSLLNEYKSNVGHKEAVIIDPHVANIVKGVSALTAAFRLVQLGQCTGNQDASCLRQLRADKLHEAILGNLKKLSFTTMGSGQARDTSPNHHFFTPDGSLVSTQRLVYIIDRDDGLQRVRIIIIGFFFCFVFFEKLNIKFYAFYVANTNSLKSVQ